MKEFLRALSFAASRHATQRRKGAGQAPYVNHLIDVAYILAREGAVTDEPILMAAVLHDTVEDTPTAFSELKELFGPVVTELVHELTDDKSLPFAVRKQHQIENAPTASTAAKHLKLADKTANLRDMVRCPPPDWTRERLAQYVVWSERVAAGLRGVNPGLERAFDAAASQARATYLP